MLWYIKSKNLFSSISYAVVYLAKIQIIPEIKVNYLRNYTLFNRKESGGQSPCNADVMKKGCINDTASNRMVWGEISTQAFSFGRGAH